MFEVTVISQQFVSLNTISHLTCVHLAAKLYWENGKRV